MDLNGIGAVITGASRGLGAALARELAGRGARVALVARNLSALTAVAQDINARGGVAYAIAGDVSDKGAVYPIAGTVSELVGPVDLVVHNASTLGALPLPLLLDTECEDLSRVLEVNLVGPFRFTKALAGPMVLRGRGLVVHLSSDAAVVPYARWGAYAASKAALDHLTRIWAEELAGTGVRFLGIDPGEMDTQMHADAIPDADRSALVKPEEVARRIAEIIMSSDRLPSGARVEAMTFTPGGAPALQPETRLSP